MFVALSAFHWQPVLNVKKIAFIAFLSGTRGLWHPSGCFFAGGGIKGSIFSHSASGMRHPSSLVIIPMVCAPSNHPLLGTQEELLFNPSGIGSKFPGCRRATLFVHDAANL